MKTCCRRTSAITRRGQPRRFQQVHLFPALMIQAVQSCGLPQNAPAESALVASSLWALLHTHVRHGELSKLNN